MKAYKIILLLALLASSFTPSTRALATNQASLRNAPSSASAAQTEASTDWYMAGANPQRTSWVSTEVRGDLKPLWYTPVEPYINPRVQVIATGGRLFLSTAKGLYSYNSDTGAQLWVYPTKFPIAASPTVIGTTAYIGVFDRHIHAVNTENGQARWISYQAGAGFDTSPLLVNNKVIAGNRDGYMYAFDSATGKLVWKFKTNGPIQFSAAYYDGKIYFVSSDMYAYALNESGGLVWKSAALPGSGYNSWWPVVYQLPGQMDPKIGSSFPVDGTIVKIWVLRGTLNFPAAWMASTNAPPIPPPAPQTTATPAWGNDPVSSLAPVAPSSGSNCPVTSAWLRR